MAKEKQDKGTSLAKGPAGLIGVVLLVYGITALIFGGHGFEANPIDGTQNGQKWLGLEGNGWTNLLLIAAGALLVFGAPLHWGAKGMSLIVGLALGAASVIALVDGDDVFGIFAANGLTKLAWGVAAAVLIVLSLLPRVGRNNKDDQDDRAEREDRRVERQSRTVKREPTPEPTSRFERESTDANRHSTGSRVVAPASDATPESRDTSRRQREEREF